MKLPPYLLALPVSAAVLAAAPLYASMQLNSEPASASGAPNANTSLSQLIERALNQDSARQQFYAQAQAMRAAGQANASEQDPKLKFGVSGLPVDSFAFDDDAMTNISLGLSQQFARGDTLALSRRKAEKQASGIASQITARELDVINALTKIWLELGYQQVARQILLDNQRLITELAAVIRTNYAVGKSEAQDLFNAELQITKLDDQLQANRQTQQKLTAQLSQWLSADDLAAAPELRASNQLDWSPLQALETAHRSGDYYPRLYQHPSVRMLDAAIAARRIDSDIAKQAYTPQFGVEMAYGYRQADNMQGQPVSDIVSAFITLDIPLFTGNRQDHNLAAAQYQLGAAQSQKDTLLKQLNSQVNALLVDQNNLSQRIARFASTLLPQARAQVKASERGYQNNTAPFNELIAASRDELALQLEYQRLITDLNLTNNNLSALLCSYSYQVDAPQLTPSAAQHSGGQQ